MTAYHQFAVAEEDRGLVVMGEAGQWNRSGRWQHLIELGVGPKWLGRMKTEDMRTLCGFKAICALMGISRSTLYAYVEELSTN